MPHPLGVEAPEWVGLGEAMGGEKVVVSRGEFIVVGLLMC